MSTLPMPQRARLARLHAGAAALALTLVLVFQGVSIWAELAAPEAIPAAKTAILWALPVMIGALILTGISGRKLAPAAPGGILRAKQRRLALAAANGLLVLVPCAIFLALSAAAGQIDSRFHTVQALEIFAGLVNFALLAANARAGRALRRA
ncbi:hypothetical protein [Phaeovulum vinaykumarii]|uniref:Transmembrane protein n=1 Tax=Phaeovulum vinaykumarii TaxID=407234 RepID=A0A1N7MHI8_9RHOB|nr:hypothetical protein [Phaeovulum vinaykumarii]SIS85468.1 hypothetical protein SAMN05421795_107126 [Phaeovulum vinaykumarii]SOC12249.1 hypothetical protein SAMN05878426_107125 [Phaeovulum vinaykumarii]